MHYDGCAMWFGDTRNGGSTVSAADDLPPGFDEVLRALRDPDELARMLADRELTEDDVLARARDLSAQLTRAIEVRKGR